MRSYNRINGTYVADSDRLINGVLRKEWGFTGTVVSDWMGVYSTADALNAGLDLEMPGPTDWRADKLVNAVKNGQVSEVTLDMSVLRVLHLASRLGRFENPGEPPEKVAVDDERDMFIREAGAQGMVLLKNEGDVLPLAKNARVAVIGHHAINVSLGGGGSARVDAIRAVTPAEGLEAAGYETKVAPGVPVYGALPHAAADIMFDAETKARSDTPALIEWFNGSKIGECITHKERKPQPEYMIKEKWPEYLSREYCTRITYNVCPKATGDHVLSIISTGPAVCFVNGTEVFRQGQQLDLRPESFYFFKSKIERRVQHPMKAGEQYTIVLESWNTDPEVLQAPPLNGKMFQGSALRFQEFVDYQQRIEEAIEIAKSVDVAIVCVGTTSEIESEGFDRETLALMEGQAEQILAVAAVNPRTVLVNFSGAPVDLTDLVDKVPAIVQAWFPGQECGHSLALALGGEIGPGGRLPLSWPRRVEDSSSWGNFPCDDDLVIRYEEGLSVGYRHFDRPDAPDPLFPFGFGLSYTTFVLSNMYSTKDTFRWVHDTVSVAVDVKNTGQRRGTAVVQFYVEMTTGGERSDRPLRELKEFQKVHDIAPGTSRHIVVSLDKYAFSTYNVEKDCWQVTPGVYKIHAGFSTAELAGFAEVQAKDILYWTGV
jgi:beta-glucosidase